MEIKFLSLSRVKFYAQGKYVTCRKTSLSTFRSHTFLVSSSPPLDCTGLQKFLKMSFVLNAMDWLLVKFTYLVLTYSLTHSLHGTQYFLRS